MRGSSSPEAQALLARILQELGEKHNDPHMIEAGLRLAAIAIKNKEQFSMAEYAAPASRPVAGH